MFEYIKGKVSSIKDEYLILENNNIGYKIMCSKYTLGSLIKTDSEVLIFTFLHVKEDGLSLYGFQSEEELELFKLLTSVSKVGPKTALSILSIGNTSEIIIAIKSNDPDFLCTAPGIGKKTAERLILELRDKVENFTINIDINTLANNNINSTNASIEKDINMTLSSLGYTDDEIKQALIGIDLKETNVEDIIKIAIKNIGLK